MTPQLSDCSGLDGVRHLNYLLSGHLLKKFVDLWSKITLRVTTDPADRSSATYEHGQKKADAHRLSRREFWEHADKGKIPLNIHLFGSRCGELGMCPALKENFEKIIPSFYSQASFG